MVVITGDPSFFSEGESMRMFWLTKLPEDTVSFRDFFSAMESSRRPPTLSFEAKKKDGLCAISRSASVVPYSPSWHSLELTITAMTSPVNSAREASMSTFSLDGLVLAWGAACPVTPNLCSLAQITDTSFWAACMAYRLPVSHNTGLDLPELEEEMISECQSSPDSRRLWPQIWSIQVSQKSRIDHPALGELWPLWSQRAFRGSVSRASPPCALCNDVWELQNKHKNWSVLANVYILISTNQ